MSIRPTSSNEKTPYIQPILPSSSRINLLDKKDSISSSGSCLTSISNLLSSIWQAIKSLFSGCFGKKEDSKTVENREDAEEIESEQPSVHSTNTVESAKSSDIKEIKPAFVYLNEINSDMRKALKNLPALINNYTKSVKVENSTDAFNTNDMPADANCIFCFNFLTTVRIDNLQGIKKTIDVIKKNFTKIPVYLVFLHFGEKAAHIKIEKVEELKGIKIFQIRSLSSEVCNLQNKAELEKIGKVLLEQDSL